MYSIVDDSRFQRDEDVQNSRSKPFGNINMNPIDDGTARHFSAAEITPNVHRTTRGSQEYVGDDGTLDKYRTHANAQSRVHSIRLASHGANDEQTWKQVADNASPDGALDGKAESFGERIPHEIHTKELSTRDIRERLIGKHRRRRQRLDKKLKDIQRD